jgi:hypothetical protein
MARLVFLFKDGNAVCSPNINETSDLCTKVKEFVIKTKIQVTVVHKVLCRSSAWTKNDRKLFILSFQLNMGCKPTRDFKFN